MAARLWPISPCTVVHASESWRQMDYEALGMLWWTSPITSRSNTVPAGQSEISLVSKILTYPMHAEWRNYTRDWVQCCIIFPSRNRRFNERDPQQQQHREYLITTAAPLIRNWRGCITVSMPHCVCWDPWRLREETKANALIPPWYYLYYIFLSTLSVTNQRRSSISLASSYYWSYNNKHDVNYCLPLSTYNLLFII